MNIYKDTTIFLSSESTKNMIDSLRNNKESISLRDDFILGIEERISFCNDGSRIEINIPEVHLNTHEYSQPVQVKLTTEHVVYSTNVATSSKYYQNEKIQLYRSASTKNDSKYRWNPVSQKAHWNQSNSMLNKAS